MPLEAIVTIVLLIVTVVAMASQRFRTDIIALLVLLFLIVSGILEAEEAFSVFGQPVILIVASIFVIGAALLDTGVATLIANQILRISQGGETYLMFVVMLSTAILTAFLDGLLVVALLLPAVLRVARQAQVSPSRLLLPLATTATLGNQLTLLGTASNPLVSDILNVSGGSELGLFTLTPYALASVGVVMAWYLTAGRRLLSGELPPEPESLSLTEVEQSYQLERVLYRLRVRSVSSLIAESLGAREGFQQRFGLNVIAIRPAGGALQPASSEQVLEQDDILIVEGDRGRILTMAQRHGLELKGTVSLEEFNQTELATVRLAELMVPFRSSLVGQSLAAIGFRGRYGLNVLAVHRHGLSIRSDLPALKLAAGDTLLVQGTPESLRGIGRNLDLVRVTDLGPQPGDRITIKAQWTIMILAAMLLLVVTNLTTLATASVMAAVALVGLKCLNPERAYRSINGSLLILIGGMLSLSLALQKTGAAELIADLIVGLSQGFGVVGSLGLVYLLTALTAQIIGGAVGAAIFAPIAISLATSQGAPAEPFAMAIAFAVMAGFIAPLTDGSNLLIREPGRYSMADYLKNTLPIFLLQTIVLLVMFTLAYDLF